jgi:hypothetical protein
VRVEPEGDEILLTCRHQDGRKDRYGFCLGLVLFRLVVPPFQVGAVGQYLVQGASLPNCLLLEGPGSYPDFFWPKPAARGTQGIGPRQESPETIRFECARCKRATT